MSGKVRTGLKRITGALLAAVWILAAVPAASAAGQLQVVQQYTTRDSVIAYVQGTEHSEVSVAQIGQEQVEEARVDWNPMRVVTWILYDNSYSMPIADREEAKKWMREFVSNHAPDEVYCIATFSNRLDRVLVRDNQLYTQIADEIDAIQPQDQDSFLMGAIGEILDEESRRADQVYVRIVILSDGGDSGEPGTSIESLRSRLSRSNVPIYTIGCGTDTQARRDMYALSADTHGRSWDIHTDDARNVANDLRYNQMPSRILIPVPNHLRNGSDSGIQIIFANGMTAVTQATMPFGEVVPPVPDLNRTNLEQDPNQTNPEQDPAQVSEPEKTEFPWKVVFIVLLVVLLLAAIGIGVYFWFRRRKESGKFRSVKQGDRSPEDGNDKTLPLDESEDAGEDDFTVPLVNDNSHLMLSLIDIDNPDNRFETPLRGRVTIGRNSSNQIVLDYDRSVSGRHCEIYLDGKNDFWIHDLNSSNGTFIEGKRVADTAEIANGSVVQMGRLQFRVGIR